MNKAFKIWIADRCARDSRISGGLGCLYRDYGNWLKKRKQGSCTYEEFVKLLGENEFLVEEFHGVALVIGLGLAEDLKAALRG